MKKIKLASLTTLLLAAPLAAHAGTVADGDLVTFSANTTAKAAEVNQNFTALKNAINDSASDITTLETDVTTLQSTMDGKVDVAGDTMTGPLVVPSITYSTPSTASVVIPAAAFSVENNTMTYSKSVTANGFTSGAGRFIAALPIPAGSKITQLQLYMYDAANPGLVSATIKTTGGVVTNSTAESTDAETSCTFCTKTSGDINATLSANVNTYSWIEVYVSVNSSSLGFYSVKVTYEYTQP